MSTDDIRCRIIEEELKTFWPQWHVVKRLGGGSFGDVFEICRDNYGVRMYSALKVLQISDSDQRTSYTLSLEDARLYNTGGSTGSFDSHDIPEVFMNEIQIMEALRGAPNIVAIDDFYFRRSSGTSSLYVRMELLTRFEDVLADRQRRGEQFTIAEVLKIGKDICTALMFCEQRGIIHRDIKPANLFVDNFGSYKVGDFGASKQMETIHPTHMMTGIGTISYMAPEIFAGRGYNNNVDIYALGMVLYQLLNNGRTPFLPTNGPYTMQDVDIANYKRLRGEKLPPLTGIWVCGETISTRLDGVIRKACDPDSHRRYRTAKEFFDALSGQGTAEPDGKVYVQKEPLTQQEEGPVLKKIVIACSAIVLVAALIIIIGLNIKPGNKEPMQTASTGNENSANAENDESPATEVFDQSVSTGSEAGEGTVVDNPPVSEASDQSVLMESEDSTAIDNYEDPAPEAPIQSVLWRWDIHAVIDKNRNLWMWGCGSGLGALGNGTTEIRRKPEMIMEGVKSVSLGEYHSAAIKTDGSLWMWGYNEYGQLGDGTTINRLKPVKIMEGVQSVSLGEYHSAAIKTDGSLWMWGASANYRLGFDSTEDFLKPHKFMEGVRSVSVGGAHGAAIKKDGSLWMWGFNSYGQLGDGSNNSRPEPVKIMENVQSVSLGYYHSAAIKTDGSLWMWGWNSNGQLGDGSTEDHLEPEKIMDGVESVSTSAFGSAVIKTDESLWVWGRYVNKLKGGSTGDCLEPYKIMGEIQTASIDGSNGAAVKTDGSLWYWGEYDYSGIDQVEPACIVEAR